jgi:hypothetical protein
MANRIFVGAVFALWLGSMSWLMVGKILPSIHEGEAPMAAGYEPGVFVAWKVYWGDRPVGHAASVRQPGVLNTTNINSRVQMEDVPLLDLVPALMRRVVGDIGSMKFDARTTLVFDSLDNFSNFKSKVSINEISSVLDLSGEVNGSFLDLKIRFGEMTYEPKVPIANRAALNEALFPDAKLPYMYVGKHWQEEMYNPFRSPTAPIETLDAEVTGIEKQDFGEESHSVMRVEFRGQPTPGVPEEDRLQAVAWVRPSDGLVLRQDVIINTSKLRFERMTPQEAMEIGKTLLQNPEDGRHGRGSMRVQQRDRASTIQRRPPLERLEEPRGIHRVN